MEEMKGDERQVAIKVSSFQQAAGLGGRAGCCWKSVRIVL